MCGSLPWKFLCRTRNLESTQWLPQHWKFTTKSEDEVPDTALAAGLPWVNWDEHWLYPASTHSYSDFRSGSLTSDKFWFLPSYSSHFCSQSIHASCYWQHTANSNPTSVTRLAFSAVLHWNSGYQQLSELLTSYPDGSGRSYLFQGEEVYFWLQPDFWLVVLLVLELLKLFFQNLILIFSIIKL